ncbi:amidase [Flagellimonas algicola]|uniref:Amidase n=1 Tax=Flagellimonas algicola TaxID=2583815 RepID=A0ABY2WRB8_9FLAO|nr:amidase [Allomuricauda algicola]TMU57054.1 amidase [Allomuricauda algicola]
MNNIQFHTATEITQLIKTGKISSETVVRHFLKQIKEHNPKINAISDLRDFDALIKEAKEKDKLRDKGKILGPLHGLPVTVKDSFQVLGLISSNGNPKLCNNVADEDAELVKRLKNAGAIVLGKTNMALYAMDWQSSNPCFGQTNNPYELNHVAGGSSGGSAAALASGFTALELGTDAGGSVRVPSHFCGVCGIRTTEMALSNNGNMATPGLPRLGRHIISNGPMARSVEDLILAMEVLWQPQTGHFINPPVPLKQFKYIGNKLRIAYSLTLDGITLDDEYKRLYQTFLNRVADCDHEMIQSKPRYSTNALVRLWGKIAGFDFGAAMKRIPFKRCIAYVFIKLRYKDSQWARGMGYGAASSPYQYARSLHLKDEVSQTFSNFFETYDIWITPVSATPAFTHQKPGVPLEVNGWQIPYTKAFIPFNFPSSIPGHPIVVIPIGLTKKGLPVGIQIHGPKWQDYKLLQIARELEKLTPGFQIPKMLDQNTYASRE